MGTATKNGVTAIIPTTNDAASEIEAGAPYLVEAIIRGTADILFHRWSNEAVAEKSKAAKNSKAKKTDNIKSYVYRLPNGNLGLPGEYVRMSMVTAAKFRQDPRSPRKSAMDLYKASIVPMTPLADLGVKDWDYEDQRRVVIQRSAVTRVRRALPIGWEAQMQFQVLTPEYIAPQDFYDVLRAAGMLVGVGDFRPTYGRFCIASFEQIALD